MVFRPKRLKYDDLRAEAEKFLDEYHAERTLPVPIEEIVEFDFEIGLIPLDGLMDDVSVDAFLTSDAKHIYIDAFVFEHRVERLRFTLAHELAHFWLHDLLYQRTKVASVKDWLQIQESMGEDSYRWFEWQANSLAGLILVPRNQLQRHFDEAVGAARDEGLNDKILFSEVGKPYVLDYLSNIFGVSNEVVEIRLHKDGLWNFPEPPLRLS